MARNGAGQMEISRPLSLGKDILVRTETSLGAVFTSVLAAENRGGSPPFAQTSQVVPVKVLSPEVA